MFKQNYANYTERARRVLTLAQEEAQRFNHNYIGTEHLLLGLMREDEGVGAKVLANLGVTVFKTRSFIERVIGTNTLVANSEKLLTPRSNKVLELAVDESMRRKNSYIGTEHLLLGLIREGEGIAAGCLVSQGVSFDEIRDEVDRVILVRSRIDEEDDLNTLFPENDITYNNILLMAWKHWGEHIAGLDFTFQNKMKMFCEYVQLGSPKEDDPVIINSLRNLLDNA